MSSNDSKTSTRILEVTVQMLEEHRGHGVRMADIAEQAGISGQAVYLHFASRTKLLDAATRFLDERLELCFGSDGTGNTRSLFSGRYCPFLMGEWWHSS